MMAKKGFGYFPFSTFTFHSTLLAYLIYDIKDMFELETIRNIRLIVCCAETGEMIRDFDVPDELWNDLLPVGADIGFYSDSIVELTITGVDMADDNAIHPTFHKRTYRVFMDDSCASELRGETWVEPPRVDYDIPLPTLRDILRPPKYDIALDEQTCRILNSIYPDAYRGFKTITSAIMVDKLDDGSGTFAIARAGNELVRVKIHGGKCAAVWRKYLGSYIGIKLLGFSDDRTKFYAIEAIPRTGDTKLNTLLLGDAATGETIQMNSPANKSGRTVLSGCDDDGKPFAQLFDYHSFREVCMLYP